MEEKEAAVRVFAGCGVLIFAVVALLAAGVVIPRFAIGDGVDRFEGEKRETAWAAHYLATGDIFDGESLDGLFIHKVRVLDVKSQDSCPSLEREAEVCGEACEEPAGDILRNELADDGEVSDEDREILDTNRRLDAVEGRFTATLRAHTFFGIPLRRLYVDCEGELR